MSNFDKAVSEAMGAAKVVKATFKGLKGVFQTMMKQHGEATAMLKHINSSTDVAVQRLSWPKLRAELVSHERAETAVVYPVLREHVDTAAIADRHEQEAAELDGLIAKLDAVTIGTDEWKRLFERLANTVSAHVAEEESEFFPKAQEVLGETEAKRLDAPFLAAKKREMSKM